MYSILINIEGIEKRKRSTWLLHIIAGFFLLAKGADYYRFTDFQVFIPLLPVGITAIASLVYGFFRKRLDASATYNTFLRVLQAVVFAELGFLMLKNGTTIDYVTSFLWAGLCIFLLLSEKQLFKNPYIIIDKEGLQIPATYRVHHVPWQSLTNVVVRQDFITIFHKKNKYLQYQVQQPLSELEVANVNAFCQEQTGKLTAQNISINAN